MESSTDSDRDCCVTMFKEGDGIITFPKAEPNESSLNRTDKQAQVKFYGKVEACIHTKLISHRPLLKYV